LVEALARATAVIAFFYLLSDSVANHPVQTRRRHLGDRFGVSGSRGYTYLSVMSLELFLSVKIQADIRVL